MKASSLLALVTLVGCSGAPFSVADTLDRARVLCPRETRWQSCFDKVEANGGDVTKPRELALTACAPADTWETCGARLVLARGAK